MPVEASALPNPVKLVSGTTPPPRRAAAAGGGGGGDGPRVAVPSAGTSDLAAAREAQRTLAWYGEPAAEFHDVGVAGLWRLTGQLEAIRRHPVLIVAAGMDAALLSVVGGVGGGGGVGVPP